MTSLLALVQLPEGGPTWGMFWGLIGVITGAVVAIGAWAIKAFLTHRLAATIALATNDARVDLKLADHRREIEALLRTLHAENVATNKEIVADLKEVAALLYGARGTIGMAEEVQHQRVVQQGVLEHMQALESWALQVTDVEGMPTYIRPRPIERRRRAVPDES